MLIIGFVCAAFGTVFWYALVFTDDPVPWILALVIVGGLLGLLQTIVFWPIVMEALRVAADNRMIRDLQSRFPDMAALTFPTEEARLHRFRTAASVQSVVQIIVASLVAWFLYG